jgi:hypothetical protein
VKRLVALALAIGVAACGDDLRGNVSIEPGPWGSAIRELVALTPYRGLTLGTGGDFAIAVVDDPAIPTEGYRVEAQPGAHWLVHAHDVLGAQYGVADALENLGFRFRHPFDPYVPRVPKDAGATGPLHQPHIAVRGFHLHTLHPTEAHFAFWIPSAGSTNDAHRIINWVIANRGNYLQWAGLDDILREPDRLAAWKPFERELIDYAHARGLRVGLEIEMFGQANLQLAFDLYDDPTASSPVGPAVARRLPLVVEDMPFDVYDLSFGEFLSAEPQFFVDTLDEVNRQINALAPRAEVHALVHDGFTQRVDYMGQNLIYYFLVKFADAAIIPDIHTTFYFNLFEPAGGAYKHPDFSEHRQYLHDRMCAGGKVAYHPEDAYWIAFDDSVPQMFPLYVRSRWVDLDGISKFGCGPLYEHLPFSTGWEWGYWLNDVMSLRNSYELPASYEAAITDELAPDLGAGAGKIVTQIAEDQHDALIGHQLAAYLASRSVDIDAGRSAGIVSQPDRILFSDLVTSHDTASFTATVLQPLATYGDALDARAKELAALELPRSRWSAELTDGLVIDQLRARFVAAEYQAVLDFLDGGDAKVAYERARSLLDQAQVVVTRRHADLHDTHGKRLLDHTPNQTLYQYGYLYMADTMCFWHRELGQVATILGEPTGLIPGCLF